MQNARFCLDPSPSCHYSLSKRSLANALSKNFILQLWPWTFLGKGKTGRELHFGSGGCAGAQLKLHAMAPSSPSPLSYLIFRRPLKRAGGGEKGTLKHLPWPLSSYLFPPGKTFKQLKRKAQYRLSLPSVCAAGKNRPHWKRLCAEGRNLEVFQGLKIPGTK